MNVHLSTPPSEARSVAADADHGRLMDGIYRNQRHIYDATRKFYLLGRDRLLKELAPRPGEAILEIACGTGRNLARARKLYPQTQMYGLDISEEMLKSARLALAKDLVGARVVLAAGDACRFNPQALFGRQQFERIFISYGLSMIPDWEAALEQAVDTLAPGGVLHVVDFGQQSELPTWFMRVLHAWLARFHVTPRAELANVLERVAARTGGTASLTPLYRDYAWLGRVEKARD